MGLDAWGVARKGELKKVVTSECLGTDEDGNKVVEDYIELEWPEMINLCDWRKHPNLQGWMRSKWKQKGCPKREDESDEDGFNGIDLVLDKDDILELQEAINGGELPATGGFFFGDDSSAFYKEQDLAFIKDALEYIEQGYTIAYGSSW